jgi:hypothetical protein
VDPPEPLAGVGGGGGLAFAVVTGVGLGAGCDAVVTGVGLGAGCDADALASSKAANGVSSSWSLSWLGVDG